MGRQSFMGHWSAVTKALVAMVWIVCEVGMAVGNSPGVENTISVEGRQRTYIAFVPGKARNPLPVVIMLHGGGGTARRIEQATGFDALAEKEGFIVVYPQAFDGHWNDGRGVEFMRAQKESVDDVKFIRAILDDVAKMHAIDRGRVFVTGVSNGGIMSHRLAAEASDVVAAIAPVVGGMAPAISEKFKPAHPVSVLVIQADADRIVPIDGGNVGIAGGAPRGQVLPTTETVAKYVQLNGNPGQAAVTSAAGDPAGRTTIEMTKYPDGSGGAKTWYFRIHEGGHTWPGGTRSGQGFSATRAVWDFFNLCPSRTTKKTAQ